MGTNRYGYSFNDPTNGKDPSGHWAEEKADGKLTGPSGDPDRGSKKKGNNGGSSQSDAKKQATTGPQAGKPDDEGKESSAGRLTNIQLTLGNATSGGEGMPGVVVGPTISQWDKILLGARATGSIVANSETETSDDPPPSNGKDTKTPNTGKPRSTHVNPGSGQVREYGEDGMPKKDIDFDYDHGQGIPHVHDWEPDPDGGFPIRDK